LSHNPTLTDEVILLRPLVPEDSTAYLAGEDDEMAKWVSGGRSTLAGVQAFIKRSQENWSNGSPRRTFGVFDYATNRVIGFIEVNQLPVLGPDQVNISYGIFNDWRGRGLAIKAINLVGQYLHATTGEKQMVLRILPGNISSLRVAEKAGFTFIGLFDEPEGRFRRYVRNIHGWT
jgi:RimJ/RimL family protein N-acetyltransferase